MKIYNKLSKENDGKKQANDFLKQEGLPVTIFQDLKPIKLQGRDLRIRISTEDPQKLLTGK